MPQSPALQGSFQPLPGVKGGAVQQCAIVVVADKVTVLDHAGAVGWTQQGAHLHSVRLVPHIQQDHVKVEGGIRGYEPRCEGRAARVGVEWKSEPPAWPRPPPPLFPLLPHQARIPPRALLFPFLPAQGQETETLVPDLPLFILRCICSVTLGESLSLSEHQVSGLGVLASACWSPASPARAPAVSPTPMLP